LSTYVFPPSPRSIVCRAFYESSTNPTDDSRNFEDYVSVPVTEGDSLSADVVAIGGQPADVFISVFPDVDGCIPAPACPPGALFCLAGGGGWDGDRDFEEPDRRTLGVDRL